MEVTHVEDKITHAVLNNSKIVDLGISNDVELFHMLSDGLYSDSTLAVVREVICNAWDAHIDAGITDTPIDITLQDDQLIIRDYGKAIHPDMMPSVYGVYGNSTKRDDTKATGGFGLGCKSPFAYTEHFEVITHHEGTKTVYIFSKSSAEVRGKPGMRVILSVPTSETGISVKIDIKRSDVNEFLTKIKDVVLRGEIKANLNGELLPTIPYSKSENDWFITKDIGYTNTNIFVKYGNVVYPVNHHDEYNHLYIFVREYLYNLNSGMGKYVMVFLAEPNTITMVPSREQLKMGERTVSTLIGHFQRFKDQFDKGISQAYVRSIGLTIANAFTNIDFRSEVYRPAWSLPSVSTYLNDSSNNHLTNLDEVGAVYTKRNYPRSDRNYRFNEFKHRLDEIESSKYANKGMVQTYRKALAKAHNDNYLDEKSIGLKWFYNHIVSPVTRKLIKEGMPTNSLWVFNKENCMENHRLDRSINKVKDYYLRSIDRYIGHLTNVIIISNNRHYIPDQLHNWARNNRRLSKEIGLLDCALLYVVPKNNVKMAQARKVLASTGATIIDFTSDVKPTPVVKTDKVPVVKKPSSRKKGLPLLSNAISKDGKRYNLYEIKNDDAERTETPEFIFKLKAQSQNGERSIHIFDSHMSRIIVKLFGSRGAVATTSNQYDKWYAKDGIKDVKEFLLDEVVKYLKGNKNIINHLSNDLSKLDTNSHTDRWITLLKKYPVFSTKLKIQTVPLTEEESNYLQLWNHMRDYPYSFESSSKKNKDYKDVYKAMTTGISNPKLVALSKKVEKNNFLSVMDLYHIETLFDENDPDKQDVITQVSKYILNALK